MDIKPNHFSENDRLFYNDGYKLAQSAVKDGITNDKLFAAIESLYMAIDGLNDSITALAERQHMKVDCHKGCHWCCHQAVYANSYELHYLSERIKAVIPPEKIQRWINSAELKYEKTSQMTEDQIAEYKHPCPLLENGACSVYAIRPMACRIYLSTSLPSCLEFYRNPDNKANYPALLELPLRAGRMMNEGFMAALKEQGIETAEFRLEDGLRIVLKNNQPNFGQQE